jgi:hypothetical protein
MRSLALCAALAAAASAAGVADAPLPRLALPLRDGSAVHLDAFGQDGIRVRVVPPNGTLVDPPLPALALDAPPKTPRAAVSILGATLTNGNLNAAVSPDGLVTFTRVSDGALLLQHTATDFAPTALEGARPGSQATAVSFSGVGAGERL